LVVEEKAALKKNKKKLSGTIYDMYFATKITIILFLVSSTGTVPTNRYRCYTNPPVPE
jgi:hypothetical protein